jgi:MFS family permease
MIYPLLPVYLSRVLGASATSLGIIEGVAEAVNSGLKIVSGWISDRQSRRRPIVIVGYALSSLARPLIALTSSWPHVLAIRALDRTGKGIRGAPRDAMLAVHADASSRGRIFGFHRAQNPRSNLSNLLNDQNDRCGSYRRGCRKSCTPY